MQLFHTGTNYSLRFLLPGHYHYACIEPGKEPDDVAPGSIIIGTGFEDEFSIKGSQEATNIFSKFLELNLLQQTMGQHNDDITLTIERTPDYTYDAQARPAEESLDIADYDWNLIEDNDDTTS